MLFLRAESQVSAYLPLQKNARTVLAGRVRIGSILGGAELTVPSDRLFYAGGGGSVRGYEYQGVGPRGDEQLLRLLVSREVHEEVREPPLGARGAGGGEQAVDLAAGPRRGRRTQLRRSGRSGRPRGVRARMASMACARAYG